MITVLQALQRAARPAIIAAALFGFASAAYSQSKPHYLDTRPQVLPRASAGLAIRVTFRPLKAYTRLNRVSGHQPDPIACPPGRWRAKNRPRVCHQRPATEPLSRTKTFTSTVKSATETPFSSPLGLPPQNTGPVAPGTISLPTAPGVQPTAAAWFQVGSDRLEISDPALLPPEVVAQAAAKAGVPVTPQPGRNPQVAGVYRNQLMKALLPNKGNRRA